MQHLFEIYPTGESITQEHWQKLYQAICQFVPLIKFELYCSCQDNVVRYFIACDKDLESLSNSIEGFILRRSPHNAITVPLATAKEHFVQFVTDGNWLDTKEKYAVKKGKDLQFAVFKIRAVNVSKALTKGTFFFQNTTNHWSKVTKVLTVFPSRLLAINFKDNAKYLHRTLPKYLNIEKSLHMLVSNNVDALFEIDSFPYFSHNYYLNLTGYEFDKHSFIVGASGSGKSKFISLFVDRLAKTALKLNYRVIVVDPHDSIASDFGHITDSRVIKFGREDSTDLFPGAGADLAAATELTATLFKSVLGDQYNPRLDRLLRFSLFVLMTAQTMSLENLKRFITDAEYRIQVVEHVHGFVPANVIKFFGADYNEIRTQYYNEAILPLVSMVEEMQLQPSMVGESELSLAKTIQENFLTVFSLNKVSMGDKVVRTVAGLLIQQIFLLAQAGGFGQKTILIIDEVSVVQNPTIAQILAEARKFNLTVILTQQYFGQVEKDLRDAIFSNVYNYYTFKVSEEDARALEGNLNIELPKELIESEKDKGVKETDVKVKIMTELHPRECIIRVMSNGQIVPALKARTVDAPQPSGPASQAKKELKALMPEKFVETERKHKSVQFSPAFIQKLANDPTQTQLAEHLNTQRKKDIHELLQEHSSSRYTLRKKDKQ
jgi:hypothetical protein